MKKTPNVPHPRKMARRPLREALVFGAKLDALSAKHPSTVSRKLDSRGRRVITGRLGGLKGCLRSNSSACPYSTAMRYRSLAHRLLRVLALPANLPPEWVFSDAPAAALASDPALAATLEKARKAFADLLSDASNQRALSLKLDRLLSP